MELEGVQLGMLVVTLLCSKASGLASSLCLSPPLEGGALAPV